MKEEICEECKECWQQKFETACVLGFVAGLAGAMLTFFFIQSCMIR